MNIKLVRLSPEYKQHLFDMMEEWLAVEQNFSPWAIRKNDYHDFEHYLKNLERKDEEDGKVPDSVFFCLDVDRDIFVGAVNIRHYLNENICHTGGHIGDGIRPSERRKGYATAMIGLALEECKKLGMNKVLMTCDKDNIGSAKSIMNNGGVPELEVEEDGILEQRYWITLKDETVETERTVLKRQIPGNYQESFTWMSDERVCKYLLTSPCRKPEELIPFMERQDPNSKERYLMIIRSKEDGHAIGASGMFYNRERDLWEFSYCIRYDDWGKGYATEATRAMIDYVKKVYHARVFEAECAKDNIGSAKVMEKLGMTCVGESSYSKRDGSVSFPSKIYRLDLQTVN